MNLILAISSAGCMPNVSRYKYGFLKKKERQAASKSKHASTCAEAAPATHMKVPLKVFELDRDRYHGVDPDVLRIALKENGTPSKRRRCTTPHESAVFNALQSDLAHGNASFRGARNMAACSAADIINGGDLQLVGIVAKPRKTLSGNTSVAEIFEEAHKVDHRTVLGIHTFEQPSEPIRST